MNLAYQSARWLVKPIQWCTMPTTILGQEHLDVSGPYVIAPTHISHLDPMIVSLLIKDEVRWMARTEFYQLRLIAWLLNAVGAFPVHRQGYPRPSLRRGLELLAQGERVGVFPEAGVARRQYSAMRGGPIKKGACFLGMHGQVPILPVALVGTHAMNRPMTWRPFRHATVYLAVGEPIMPEPLHDTLRGRRQQRAKLGQRLNDAYPKMYQQLLQLDGVDDNHDLSPGEPNDPSLVRVDPDAAAGTLNQPDVTTNS